MASGQQPSRRISYVSSLSKTFSRRPTAPATDDDDDGDDDGEEEGQLPKGSLGLHTIHSPPEADVGVDLIFVHGLGGDARKTWSKAGQNFWPRDWLPADPAFNHVRIHTYGYDSAYLKGRDDCLNIHHMGKALLGEMSTSPSIAASKTRLIAVGHSMGGLVIKKMYILAKQDASYRNLASRLSAIYFLATPHRGADSARLLSNILRALHERTYISDLGRGSAALQVINEEFRHISEGLELWSFYETQTMKRFSSPIVDPESAVLGYREEKQVPMSADHRSICKFDSPADANYLLIRNSLALTLARIGTQTSEAESNDARTQLRELRKYLRVPDVLDEDDFLTAKEARMGDSCRWILDAQAYGGWTNHESVEAGRRILWLKGLPATGKSVLAAFVAETLQSSGQACSYFFFKYADKSKTRLSTCLRSLALQAAVSDAETRDAILGLREDDIRLGDADERTLWRSLFVNIILKRLKRPLFWVLDALDECSNPTTLFDVILPSLDASSSLRILMTSRDTAEMDQGFKTLSYGAFGTLAISVAHTIPDLDLIIRTKVETLPVLTAEERRPLIQAILAKSKGSFLWTLLVLKELSFCHSKKEIDNILEEIPRGMRSFYKRTLDMMTRAARGRELARSILVWAASASRPLTVSELSGALVYDIDDSFPNLGESIAALCGQLVAVDRSGRVQMVHETAREFLLSDGLDSEFAVDAQSAHARMARACLRYLGSDEMKPPRTARRRAAAAAPSKRSDFFAYASPAFSQHLARVSGSHATRELLPLLVQFMKSSNILAWIESIAVSQDLGQLIHTAKRLRKFLEICSAELSPLDPQIHTVRQWSTDLTRVAAKFADALAAFPPVIYSLVPPLCPTGSMIHRAAGGGQGRGLTVARVSSEQWDDRLLSVNFGGRPSVLRHSDEFLAVGLQTGSVVLYYATSHQQYKTINHGENVQFLAFRGRSTGMLVTCGVRLLKVWNLKTGTVTHELRCPFRPAAVAFDGPRLLVASQRGYLRCWTFDGETMSDDSSDRYWSNPPSPDDGGGGGSSEDHRPRPPSGSPYSIRLSVAQQMLAVAYSGRPVCLWDLEEDAYFGECGKRLPNGELSRHRVVDMVFNPNPSVPLLAVTYLDGDLAILDPFADEQLECVRAHGHTLTSSPDGRLLAAGGANGVIGIYKFDTLELICRIRSSNSHIQQMSFSADSLRLADIRSTQCTVWEPASLLRGLLNDDSSSNTSASVVVDTVSLGADSRITAMIHAVGKGLDLIVCGREDGVLAFHDAKTTAVLATCGNHKAAFLHLRWCPTQGAVLSADASNTICLRRIKMVAAIQGGRLPQIELLFQMSLASEQSVTDLVIADGGDRFLISTDSSDHVFSIDGTLIAERVYQDMIAQGPRWMQHPKSQDHLLWLGDGGNVVCVHSWADWSEVSMHFMPGSVDDMTQLKSAQRFRLQGRPYVLLEYGERNGSTRTGHIAAFRAEETAPVAEATATRGGREEYRSEEALEKEKLMERSPTAGTLQGAGLSLIQPTLPDSIAHIIGVNDRGRLIFLDQEYWICSCDLKEAFDVSGSTQTKSPANLIPYTKHCFVLYEWLAGRRDIICGLTHSGIVFARTDDVVVIKGYSEYSEQALGQCRHAAGRGSP